MMTPKQNSPLVTQFSVNPTKKYDIGVHPPISMMTVLPAVQLVTLFHEFVPGNNIYTGCTLATKIRYQTKLQRNHFSHL